jgi:hypothetical protein
VPVSALQMSGAAVVRVFRAGTHVATFAHDTPIEDILADPRVQPGSAPAAAAGVRPKSLLKRGAASPAAAVAYTSGKVPGEDYDVVDALPVLAGQVGGKSLCKPSDANFSLFPKHLKSPLSLSSVFSVSADVFQNLVLASAPARAQKLNASNSKFKDVVTSVFLHHHSQMQHATTPEFAWALYQLVRETPQTSTKMHVQQDLGIIVNGPAFETKPSILRASGKQGEQLLVKVLKADLESAASLEQRKAELEGEARVSQLFGSRDKDFAFIHAEVHQLKMEGESWSCIVMPHMAATLATAAQLPFGVLLEQGQRIYQALQHMHVNGIVHLDVKGDNIFIDQSGKWHLGDFGSCKPVGQPVTSSTPGYYPRELRGSLAAPAFDDFMLAFTLLIAASTLGEVWMSLYTPKDTVVPPLPLRDGIERRLQQLEQSPEPQPTLATFIRQVGSFDSHFPKGASTGI